MQVTLQINVKIKITAFQEKNKKNLKTNTL
jgi:hypothetical protein